MSGIGISIGVIIFSAFYTWLHRGTFPKSDGRESALYGAHRTYMAMLHYFYDRPEE
jgi:hypothetical protein